jgi:nitroimidazol reductase NimA-like FMN-containing flavoprotein (pyridoxamine 5'-phosphate oxidase superfamily)
VTVMSTTQSQHNPAIIAAAIIDLNFYMTLGTVDEHGHPWVSPLYYAVAKCNKFFWVSSPEAKHSRSLAANSHISIVIFDSRAPVGTGQAVYMSAIAERVVGLELEPAIQLFSDRSQSHGAPQWNAADVLPPAAYCLYCATVSEHWILGRDGHSDRRILVNL